MRPERTHAGRRAALARTLSSCALLAAVAVALGGAPHVRAQSRDAPRAAGGDRATAIFAGGCFWCMEPPFDKLDGVLSTTSGYIGGRVSNPTYEQVSAGGTGHVEAVQVVYDPSKVSYARLLEVFWRNVDPTVDDRQFCDIGPMYRPAVFWVDEAQRRAAEASKAALAQSKPFPEPIRVAIEPATRFWPAEAYHQDYYLKNPIRYRFYRASCGRDARLSELWGDPPR